MAGYKSDLDSKIGRAIDPIDIALGLVPGAEPFCAFGERGDLDIAAAGEDIWPGAAAIIPTPADAGEAMSIVSTDAADDIDAGTGVRKVHIHYLDADGIPQFEEKEMEGLTPVALTATDVRFVQKVHAVENGSVGVAVGDITIYKNGAASTIYSMIEAGGNMSLVPHRMVPANKRLVVLHWHATESKSKSVSFRLRATAEGGVLHPGTFIFKDTIFVIGSGLGVPVLFVLPSLSILKISGWSGAAAAGASCGWHGVLFDNNG